MEEPTPTMAFEAMYAIAADDGREEALFGGYRDLVLDAYKRTLIGGGYPSAYLEFPLLGEPCLDVLSVYGTVDPGARFAAGAGFGYQPMLNWFSGLGAAGEEASCGIEVDFSTGETERAGAYLQQRGRTELVHPFLESVGDAGRAEGYLEALERMPPGWPPAYVGVFPGRTGTPLRIGGYMGRDEHARCAADPSHLAQCFDQIGFSAYDDAMLGRCAEFMRIAPSVDFQFDILPDRKLGDTFGLSLSFNETKPREARACMEDGYGARLMGVLQSWGLADDRWRRIAGAAFARHVGYLREDGTEGRFALSIRFNYAKVKFTACEPRPAKFYLVLAASELEA